MDLQTSIRFIFDVSQNEFNLIIRALRNTKTKGDTATALADDLEYKRAKHFEDMIRRFQTHIRASEGVQDANRTRKSDGEGDV